MGKVKIRNDTDITAEKSDGSLWVDFEDPSLSSISIFIGQNSGRILIFPKGDEMADALAGLDLLVLEEEARQILEKKHHDA